MKNTKRLSPIASELHVWNSSKHPVISTHRVLALVIGLAMLAVTGASETAVYRGGPEYFWKVTKVIQDKKRAYVSAVDSGNRRMLYETDKDFVLDIRVSPCDTIIALLTGTGGYAPPGEHGYTVQPRNYLVVIDTAGREIARLDEDVREFSWSPDGQKIAYITGTYNEDGDIGFKATGVGMFDPTDSSRTAIREDSSDRAASGRRYSECEIYWAPHDGHIYVKDFNCVGSYRYDTKTGSTQPVPYRTIDLSPDGQYYRMPMAPWNDSLRVCSTASNEDVLDRFWRRFGAPQRDYYFDWVFDRGHLAHVVVRQYGFASEQDRRAGNFNRQDHICNVLYDVEKDEIVKELDSPASLWTAGPGKLVLEEDGKFKVLTYDDVYGQH